MYDLDLEKVNRSLVTALKLAVAVRRMLGWRGEAVTVVIDLEREIREAGAECQRVLELVKGDENRPVITG